MPHTHRLTPNQPLKLDDIDPDGKEIFDDRDRAEAEFEQMRDQIIELQYRLYAENKQSLLIVFQAMDAGGKDGAIRHLTKGINPQGVHVASFKAPSKEELAHDFLWRIHQQTPAKGKIGIFNRSHYEDVLIVRVDNLVPETVWRPRYQHINNFERLLHDNGTRILKFYLHISKKEQKERFQSRLDEPHKNWKFAREDLNKRQQWTDYMVAYEEMLNQCTTDYAPWYVIPADQKWYRNYAIAKIVLNTLQEMNPQYPPPEDNLDQIVID
ncbi:MAG TPA: polyphosphate kinase 2 family protein [Anaerolineae bacterium]|nr:polyphosphate kinase 2 family protein [Anaerolineae bacterium]